MSSSGSSNGSTSSDEESSSTSGSSSSSSSIEDKTETLKLQIQLLQSQLQLKENRRKKRKKKSKKSKKKKTKKSRKSSSSRSSKKSRHNISSTSSKKRSSGNSIPSAKNMVVDVSATQDPSPSVASANSLNTNSNTTVIPHTSNNTNGVPAASSSNTMSNSMSNSSSSGWGNTNNQRATSSTWGNANNHDGSTSNTSSWGNPHGDYSINTSWSHSTASGHHPFHRLNHQHQRYRFDRNHFMGPTNVGAETGSGGRGRGMGRGRNATRPAWQTRAQVEHSDTRRRQMECTNEFMMSSMDDLNLVPTIPKDKLNDYQNRQYRKVGLLVNPIPSYSTQELKKFLGKMEIGLKQHHTEITRWIHVQKEVPSYVAVSSMLRMFVHDFDAKFKQHSSDIVYGLNGRKCVECIRFQVIRHLQKEPMVKFIEPGEWLKSKEWRNQLSGRNIDKYKDWLRIMRKCMKYPTTLQFGNYETSIDPQKSRVLDRSKFDEMLIEQRPAPAEVLDVDVDDTSHPTTDMSQSTNTHNNSSSGSSRMQPTDTNTNVAPYINSTIDLNSSSNTTAILAHATAPLGLTSPTSNRAMPPPASVSVQPRATTVTGIPVTHSTTTSPQAAATVQPPTATTAVTGSPLANNIGELPPTAASVQPHTAAVTQSPFNTVSAISPPVAPLLQQPRATGRITGNPVNTSITAASVRQPRATAAFTGSPSTSYKDVSVQPPPAAASVLPHTAAVSRSPLDTVSAVASSVQQPISTETVTGHPATTSNTAASVQPPPAAASVLPHTAAVSRSPLDTISDVATSVQQPISTERVTGNPATASNTAASAQQPRASATTVAPVDSGTSVCFQTILNEEQKNYPKWLMNKKLMKDTYSNFSQSYDDNWDITEEYDDDPKDRYNYNNAVYRNMYRTVNSYPENNCMVEVNVESVYNHFRKIMGNYKFEKYDEVLEITVEEFKKIRETFYSSGAAKAQYPNANDDLLDKWYRNEVTAVTQFLIMLKEHLFFDLGFYLDKITTCEKTKQKRNMALCACPCGALSRPWRLEMDLEEKMKYSFCNTRKLNNAANFSQHLKDRATQGCIYHLCTKIFIEKVHDIKSLDNYKVSRFEQTVSLSDKLFSITRDDGLKRFFYVNCIYDMGYMYQFHHLKEENLKSSSMKQWQPVASQDQLIREEAQTTCTFWDLLLGLLGHHDLKQVLIKMVQSSLPCYQDE